MRALTTQGGRFDSSEAKSPEPLPVAHTASQNSDHPLTLAGALDARPAHEPVVPFWADLAGDVVRVTCVLERTAVYEVPGDRKLARLDLFAVDPGELTWKKRDKDRWGQQAIKAASARYRQKPAEDPVGD